MNKENNLMQAGWGEGSCLLCPKVNPRSINCRMSWLVHVLSRRVDIGQGVHPTFDRSCS